MGEEGEEVGEGGAEGWVRVGEEEGREVGGGGRWIGGQREGGRQ